MSEIDQKMREVEALALKYPKKAREAKPLLDYLRKVYEVHKAGEAAESESQRLLTVGEAALKQAAAAFEFHESLPELKIPKRLPYGGSLIEAFRQNRNARTGR